MTELEAANLMLDDHFIITLNEAESLLAFLDKQWISAVHNREVKSLVDKLKERFDPWNLGERNKKNA